MIRIAVVEDEKKYRSTLTEYITRYSKEHGIETDVRLFTDGEEIMNGYDCEYDLILMDIMMRTMDGMTTAEQIRKRDGNVVIIFITNMSNYAIKGYQVGAFDYILKPLSYFAFCKSIDRALPKLKASDEVAYISIPLANGMQKLNIKDIQYIESDRHYLIFCCGQENFRSYMRMKDAEESLVSKGFFRCNKGILVNLRHVDSAAGNCCVVNGTQLPISRGMKSEFMAALTEFMSNYRVGG